MKSSWTTAAGAALAVIVALCAWSTRASAAPSTSTGAEGQSLSVSQVDDLNPGGAQITVTGAGYDAQKGIYVAFCVTPAAGAAPTPCGGGADMSGSAGMSGWISSNPPSYGKDLAQPYGPGGTFSVTMTLTPMIGEVDCRTTSCAVVTRADHTRLDDRSQDVIVPVTWGSPGTTSDSTASAATPTSEPVPTAAPQPPPTLSVSTSTSTSTSTATTSTADDADSNVGSWLWITAAIAGAATAVGVGVQWRRSRARKTTGSAP